MAIPRGKWWGFWKMMQKVPAWCSAWSDNNSDSWWAQALTEYFQQPSEAGDGMLPILRRRTLRHREAMWAAPWFSPEKESLSPIFAGIKWAESQL